MRAKIDVVERTDHRGNRESRKIESETFRAQIGGLHIFVHRAVEVRQQAAERHLALSLRLPQGLGRACFAEVVREPALNRFPQAKFSVERHLRDARRASRVSALHLHAGTQRVHGGRGARRGRLGSFHACRWIAPCVRKAEVARPACPAIVRQADRVARRQARRTTAPPRASRARPAKRLPPGFENRFEKNRPSICCA